jgi:hypothetical protein
MYKKSIARIDKEHQSSQAELSNPALNDIIATNHVVLAKVKTNIFLIKINRISFIFRNHVTNDYHEHVKL